MRRAALVALVLAACDRHDPAAPQTVSVSSAASRTLPEVTAATAPASDHRRDAPAATAGVPESPKGAPAATPGSRKDAPAPSGDAPAMAAPAGASEQWALPDETARPETAPAASAGNPVGGPDFAAVFARVAPSVVGVASGRTVDGRFEPAHFGSGFVWDDAGHVVTSDHVLARGEVVRVRTYGGRVHAARVTGRDEATDVALLVVEGATLKPAPRGSARDLRPGQWVAAIGNPYGMDHSITVGVVSALGRNNLPPGAPRYTDFVQTDASVNPGSSGGPLVDGHGRVVAVSTAMLDRGQGLAFATPIDMVATVVGALAAHGRFERGFAGFVPRAVTVAEARGAGLNGRQGARVNRVVPGGPAERAGLAVGDIILRFGAAEVARPDDLPWLIAATRPGTRVPLELVRGAERLRLELVVDRATD